MTVETEIPADHPRKVSLLIRDTIIAGHTDHVVATAGLLAHGRGEAFDYLIGEQTTQLAEKAIKAAVASLLLARHPVISVNGNTCSLVPNDLVALSEITRAPLEINLFYYREDREDAIIRVLRTAGAKAVLGTRDRPSATIPELSSNRRKVDSEGIWAADVVVVPLEDGDRTEALKSEGKFVVAIDLNPMSRTAIYADITIVDNVVRALPLMVKYALKLKKKPKRELQEIVRSFNNDQNLGQSIRFITSRLEELSRDISVLRQKKPAGVRES
ncbi:MAG: phosphopantothenate/pantothenate synthetase [Candidatus Thorarchaeota archaeon]|nr:MAG: phosphopantothenate/pantothenate synthetase [Candidatus Thorarchaeota archaeon]